MCITSFAIIFLGENSKSLSYCWKSRVMKLLVGLSLCYWLKDNVHHLIIKKFKSKHPKSVWSLIFSPKKIANECKNLFLWKIPNNLRSLDACYVDGDNDGWVLYCTGQRLMSISVLLLLAQRRTVLLVCHTVWVYSIQYSMSTVRLLLLAQRRTQYSGNQYFPSPPKK